MLVLQSFCLFCKGNGFWNVFTFSSTDVRSRQVPPKSQEATGLCSKGLLGSTGKIIFFFFQPPPQKAIFIWSYLCAVTIGLDFSLQKQGQNCWIISVCVCIYTLQITLLWKILCFSLVQSWYNSRVKLVIDIKACPWITCAVLGILARLTTTNYLAVLSSSFSCSLFSTGKLQDHSKLLYFAFGKNPFFCVFSATDSFSQSLWEWKPARIRAKIFQWNGVSDLPSLPSYQQAKYLHCAEKNKWNNEVKTQIQGSGHTAKNCFPLHL